MAKSGGRRGSVHAVIGQAGTCQLCGGDVARRSVRAHLLECAPAHDVSTGAMQPLVQLRATSPGSRLYWMDVEVKADAKLEVVDAFLRRVWLECCGHLSMFRIGGLDYFSRGYDSGFARDSGTGATERRMTTKLRDALCGDYFEYEYDFGSTTVLGLEVTDERSGRIGKPAVRLLARNSAPVFPCATCGAPATLICPYCVHEGPDALTCQEHRGQHRCGEEDALLPVVNSPRTGVCAYVG